jgi:hypothetical protein
VIINVLKNDMGCGELNITEACAENGSVEIKDGKLHYTPNEGFCGEDVITYSIGDENCMTDTAHVYMNVESIGLHPSTPVDCPTTPNECLVTPNDYCLDDYKLGMKDHEYSSTRSDDSLFSDRTDQIGELLNDKLGHVESLVQDKLNWASAYNSNSFESSACAPIEEPVAIC